MAERPLTDRQRRFADAYAGPGTGAQAASAAGYRGTGDHLRSVASKQLRDARVRTRIEARLGPLARFQGTAEPAAPEPAGGSLSPLRPGVGRGTATERVTLLMNIGRKKRKLSPEDRIRVAAILGAAELEGERQRSASRGASRQGLGALPEVPKPTGPGVARLRLVLSEIDREDDDTGEGA